MIVLHVYIKFKLLVFLVYSGASHISCETIHMKWKKKFVGKS
jgi:hypothetical protein